MTAEEARTLIAKYGSQSKAAKAAGVARSTLQRALASDGKATVIKPAVVPRKAGKTLADFRQTYDKSTIIPARVRDALKALGSSGWEYEVEFAKTAGVSLADLGRFRDQFADFVVAIGRDSRRAWAGSKATANAMREMLT
jgi:NADH dehydrogenase/NADH:ubiquinone oxidoreductase subunit G